MPRTPRQGGAQDPRGMGKRQPGRWGSQARTPTHKPPSHLCTLQPAPPPAECDPTGEGGGEAHLRIFAGGHPFPLGTAWRAGQTEELTMFIMIRREPHPGAAPSIAGPSFPPSPQTPDLMGASEGKGKELLCKGRGLCQEWGKSGRWGSQASSELRSQTTHVPNTGSTTTHCAMSLSVPVTCSISQPNFELTVWPWASSSAALCLSFLLC